MAGNLGGQSTLGLLSLAVLLQMPFVVPVPLVAGQPLQLALHADFLFCISAAKRNERQGHESPKSQWDVQLSVKAVGTDILCSWGLVGSSGARDELLHEGSETHHTCQKELLPGARGCLLAALLALPKICVVALNKAVWTGILALSWESQVISDL